MKKHVAVTAFALMALAAVASGQSEIFSVKEMDSKRDIRPLASRDAVSESSHLVICIPEGWIVDYDVVDRKGVKKKSGVLNAYVTFGPEGRVEAAEGAAAPAPSACAAGGVAEYDGTELTRPVSEDAKFGFGAEGDEIWFNAYEDGGTAEPENTEFYKIEIVKAGWKLYTPDSFNLTPLFIYEIGKKKDPAGETTNGFAPGAGLTYLLFRKDPKHKVLSNLGLGGNASLSKTQLLGDGDVAPGATGVATLGGVVAYKLPVETPVILQLVVGTNVTGDDRYLLIGGGVATPTALK
jgi:hypothetical protein